MSQSYAAPNFTILRRAATTTHMQICTTPVWPSASSTLLTSSNQLCRSRIHNQHRCISLLNPRRPILPCISSRTTLAAPSPTSSLLLCSPESLDIAGKISCHPGLQSTQIRCGPRDTYNPSHIVRKRRHGFLSRIRTKKGRKLLMRRLKKGRWNLSH